MGTTSRSLRAKDRRGALQAAELLVVLPVLGLVLMGTVQMGSFFTQQHRLQAAADIACRSGMGPFQNADARFAAIEEEFYASLGNVAWTEKCELAVDLDESSGDRVTVSVQVPARAAVPNLLGWIGLGITDDQMLTAQATMRRS